MTQAAKCLILDFDHEVEPLKGEDSIFATADEYDCPRCGKPFSEPHPTRTSSTVCSYDPAYRELTSE